MTALGFAPEGDTRLVCFKKISVKELKMLRLLFGSNSTAVNKCYISSQCRYVVQLTTKPHAHTPCEHTRVVQEKALTLNASSPSLYFHERIASVCSHGLKMHKWGIDFQTAAALLQLFQIIRLIRIINVLGVIRAIWIICVISFVRIFRVICAIPYFREGI